MAGGSAWLASSLSAWTHTRQVDFFRDEAPVLLVQGENTANKCAYPEAGEMVQWLRQVALNLPNAVTLALIQLLMLW